MKTNPATRYVTARSPKVHVPRSLFRVYYRILSRLFLRLFAKFMIPYTGIVTRGEGLTNLRSGGTYHAQVSVSPSQLNLLAFAILFG